MLFLRLEKEVEKLDIEVEERSLRPGLGGRTVRTGVPPLELGPDPGPEFRNMLCALWGMRPPLLLLLVLVLLTSLLW